MLKPGDQAPPFTLKNDAGADVSLSDFRGKRVILFIFPKANTPG
jgi:thioredoxin-dependent peroxiredoxin